MAYSLGDIIAARIFTFSDPGAPSNPQLGLNILHYLVTDQPLLPVNEVFVAAAISSNCHVEYKTVMSNTAEFRGVTVQRIRPLPIQDQFASIANRAFGADATEPMPGFTAAVITKRTGIAGRRFRGRLYVPFPTESLNAGTGSLTAGALLAYQALANKLITSILATDGVNTITLKPILFHKNNLPPPTLIDSFLARPRWATQKRRGFGRSPDAPPL